MTAPTTITHPFSRVSSDKLRVFSFDLQSQESELLFDCDVRRVLEPELSLQGDFVYLSVIPDAGGESDTSRILLLNWKTRAYLQVVFVDEEVWHSFQLCFPV